MSLSSTTVSPKKYIPFSFTIFLNRRRSSHEAMWNLPSAPFKRTGSATSVVTPSAVSNFQPSGAVMLDAYPTIVMTSPPCAASVASSSDL